MCMHHACITPCIHRIQMVHTCCSQYIQTCCSLHLQACCSIPIYTSYSLHSIHTACCILYVHTCCYIHIHIHHASTRHASEHAYMHHVHGCFNTCTYIQTVALTVTHAVVTQSYRRMLHSHTCWCCTFIHAPMHPIIHVSHMSMYIRTVVSPRRHMLQPSPTHILPHAHTYMMQRVHTIHMRHACAMHPYAYFSCIHIRPCTRLI
jgi:hypothetical protein